MADDATMNKLPWWMPVTPEPITMEGRAFIADGEGGPVGPLFAALLAMQDHPCATHHAFDGGRMGDYYIG